MGGVVEQVSCDDSYVKAFLDEPSPEPEEEEEGKGKEGGDPGRQRPGENDAAPSLDVRCGALAESIRAKICSSTGCAASVGVGPNKFLAKLATDRAKPDGSRVVTDPRGLLEGTKLRDLPGVGWKTERKLAADGLVFVRDVWELGDEAPGRLGSVLGGGNGAKLLLFCEGEDDRPVRPAARKTIGAECN